MFGFFFYPFPSGVSPFKPLFEQAQSAPHLLSPCPTLSPTPLALSPPQLPFCSSCSIAHSNSNYLSMPEQNNILDHQPGRIQEVHSSCKAASDSLGLFSHPEGTGRMVKTSLRTVAGHEMTDSMSSSSVQRLPRAQPSSVSHLQPHSVACMIQGPFKAM